MTKTDQVFSAKKKKIVPFVFNKEVVDVFPDMLKRSIPGYEASLQMIALFASRLAKDGSRMYDLGSSLGAASLALVKGNSAKSTRVLAVDNSPSMIERAKELLAPLPEAETIQLICADIRNIKIEKASLVVLNYTLQFLDPSERTELIQSIYSGLLPGGGPRLQRI